MLSNGLRNRAKHWIIKRFPTAKRFHVRHQSLFIMPTKFGALYLLATLIIFILGTNYQNNPILLLSYFLFFMFMWSLHACFINLNNTQFEISSVTNGFAGEYIHLNASFSKDQQTLWPHQLTFWHESTQLHCEILEADSSRTEGTSFQVTLPAVRRGYHELPMLKVKTEYPFGLIKAWSFLHFDESYWVYPKPKPTAWQFSDITIQANDIDVNDLDLLDGDEQLAKNNEGEERQFDGLKSYSPGAPMSQVAWKQFAKQVGDDLLLKDFVEEHKRPIALTLQSIQSDGLEKKLSGLTHAILQLKNDQHPFVLTLSGYKQPVTTNVFNGSASSPSQQDAQIESCLQQLATFAQSRPSKSKQAERPHDN